MPIPFITGILVVIVGWTYTFIAILFYPGAYSPLVNYLSDLGYYKGNPLGAYIYIILE